MEPVADATAEAEFALADARADSVAATARLEQILGRMPDQDREVLQLFAWADMSYAEVAQALGIPLGTVRSRLNRATCSYTPESAQTDQLSADYSGYGEYAESGSGVDLTVT